MNIINGPNAWLRLVRWCCHSLGCAYLHEYIYEHDRSACIQYVNFKLKVIEYLESGIIHVPGKKLDYEEDEFDDGGEAGSDDPGTIMRMN